MSFVTLGIQQGVNRLLNAITLANGEAFAYALNEDAGMRVWRWDGLLTLRPRTRIIEHFISEWTAWSEPLLQTISVVPGLSRGSAEFRIFAYEHGRYVEHNRALFVTFRGERIQWVDMYCAEPIPSAHRSDWMAPESISDGALARLFDEFEQIADPRDLMPPESHVSLGLKARLYASLDTHPGGNGGGNARWTDADADANIEALIAQHRARNAGFTWHVGPWDTPADLPQRLEKHGFVFAGDTACMARTDLGDLSGIVPNEQVEIVQFNSDDDAAIDQAAAIAARSFHLTPEQAARELAIKRERIRNPKYLASELHFLARLDGVPAAEATLILRGGVAYLGGAATLPEYRNRRIFTTLLRRRLETAYARGYRVALVHAEPMSRRIVAKYGFREVGRFRFYAWMPVIDMNVIRSLVPDE